MARAAISVQTITKTGLTPSYSSAIADGHSFDNTSERVFLHVKNDSGSSVTVTIQTPQQVDGLDVQDRTVSVPASGEKMIGTFNKATYNQADNSVYIDYSAYTSVTVAAIKVI